jgi:hypothetical protein
MMCPAEDVLNPSDGGMTQPHEVSAKRACHNIPMIPRLFDLSSTWHLLATRHRCGPSTQTSR